MQEDINLKNQYSVPDMEAGGTVDQLFRYQHTEIFLNVIAHNM